MNLSSLTIPASERRTCSVDVSRFFGADVSITFKEPDAAGLFQVGALAKTVKAIHPDWPDALCQSVCLLAVSHVAPDPGGKDALQWYGEIADANEKMYLFILNGYQAAFPDATDLDGAIDAAKNA